MSTITARAVQQRDSMNWYRRNRQVYAYQQDRTLWRDRPEYKTKSALRIEKLEAGLREIRDIANVSEGVEFYAMLATKTLEK